MLEPFQFKQFSVQHHRSTMPVGTDAVLLGAWANITGSERILDAGCGCGIISLMAAQRSNAFVVGIDIHEPSIYEAWENARNSPWAQRISFVLTPLHLHQPVNKYNHILSNPPYFRQSLLPINPLRRMARHSGDLSLEALMHHGHRMLCEDGSISMIMPRSSLNELLRTAGGEGYQITRLTHIVGRQGKTSERVLIEITTRQGVPYAETHLIMRNSDGEPTSEYKAMVDSFYLRVL